MNGATQALSGASEAPSTEDAQQQQSSSGSNGTPAGEGNGAAAAAAAAAAGLKKRKKDALKPIITTENPAPTSQPATAHLSAHSPTSSSSHDDPENTADEEDSEDYCKGGYHQCRLVRNSKTENTQ
ncbi:hypothetical protein MCOR02_001009 [Pyricularia oryzae]|nr:hypothetical protein MCOR02_001009 [Pyricularia oryzae]